MSKLKNHRTIHIGSDVWHYRFGKANAVIVSPTGMKTVVDYNKLTGQEWLARDWDEKFAIGPKYVSDYIRNVLMMDQTEILARKQEHASWLARNRHCPGKIEYQKFGMDGDHRFLTSWVGVADAGGIQGFGGGFFPNQADLDAYQADLCHTFGVKTPKELVGKECFALRNFGHHNDSIEGLESKDTGKRFLHSKWFRGRYPEKSFKSPLEEKKQRLEENMIRSSRAVAEIEAELERVEENYTDWENQ